MAEALNEAMKYMRLNEKAAIELVYLDGLTHKEAGKKLGVGGARVQQLVQKGLRTLRHPERVSALEEFGEAKIKYSKTPASFRIYTKREEFVFKAFETGWDIRDIGRFERNASLSYIRTKLGLPRGVSHKSHLTTAYGC